MPKAITKEEREKIIKHKQNGEKETDIAKWLFISKSSVTKIWSLFQTTGELLTKYSNCGRHASLTDEQIITATNEIKENSDITILELIEKYNLPITESGMSKVLKRLDFTYKKKHYMTSDRTSQTCKKSVKNGNQLKRK